MTSENVSVPRGIHIPESPQKSQCFVFIWVNYISLGGSFMSEKVLFFIFNFFLVSPIYEQKRDGFFFFLSFFFFFSFWPHSFQDISSPTRD